MDKKEIIDKLNEEKVFWSYDVQKGDPIADEVLIEKTLVYLDLEEIDALFELFSYKKIKKVWLQKVKSQEPRLHNLNLFLGKWYFNK